MIINRIWQMPNSKTFQIKPIKEFVEKYIKDKKIHVLDIVRKAINLTQIMQGFPSRRILKSDFRF